MIGKDKAEVKRLFGKECGKGLEKDELVYQVVDDSIEGSKSFVRTMVRGVMSSELKPDRVDTRLVGKTAENIFLSVLNQRGIFATAFDTEALDGIVFDREARYFKGPCPSYVQIKCRGSQTTAFNPQGHSASTVDNILKFATKLEVPETSVYLVVGFFCDNDIRTIKFFAVPFGLLHLFRKGEHGDHQYRFSVDNCQRKMVTNPLIFEI